MSGRICAFIKQSGDRCRVAPLEGEEFCFWHDPAHADEAAEARRLGGLRRRREKTLEGAYDIDGLASVPQIRRLLEIATMDALGLENSVARGRLLVSVTMAAAKLLEVGELEERLEAVESALGPRLKGLSESRHRVGNHQAPHAPIHGRLSNG